MDPEVAYKNMMQALTDFYSVDDMDKQIEAAQRLAEAAQALDGWLKQGGALPEAWHAAQPRVKGETDKFRLSETTTVDFNDPAPPDWKPRHSYTEERDGMGNRLDGSGEDNT